MNLRGILMKLNWINSINGINTPIIKFFNQWFIRYKLITLAIDEFKRNFDEFELN